MILILGYMFCFYLVVKGIEVYAQAIASDIEQKTNAVKIATGLMFACFVAAACFIFWLNSKASSAADVPALWR
jgi:Na+/proline symporter